MHAFRNTNRTGVLMLALALMAGLASGCAPTRQPPTSLDAAAAMTKPPAAPSAILPARASPPAATRVVPSVTPQLHSPTAPGEPVEFACEAHPATLAMVAALEAEDWLAWVRQLSGAEPVIIAGQMATIRTRYTPAMFGTDGESGQTNARAFDYLLQTVRGWYPEEQIEIMPFAAPSRAGEPVAGKNLILTLPGATHPEEVIILSAHLDSTARDDPETLAPGAEDNGAGAAALFEAARLFRDMRFARTVRIIWFTGEEQGLLGSRAYAQRLPDPDAVLAVVNLDMFGYDSDGDRCVELHVGTLPASDRAGRCLLEAAAALGEPLDPHDYLLEDAISGSDHGPFWERGIGAVEVLENMFDNQMPGGCPNADPSPYYHSAEDTHDRLDPQTGIRVVRAALAAVAAMAGPLAQP